MTSEADPRRETDRILGLALELADEERGRYIAEACGGDAPLLARLTRLLLAAESDDFAPGGALAGPLGASWLEDRPRDGEDLSGQRLGPWRLDREIGRGGMAVVFLADRADGQFNQQVAIKLLKRGVDTDEVVARFAQERRILASLEHPSIARLLDAGVTPDGRPWLAMEYVDGEPIDRWADGQRLSVRARVARLLVVARSVAAAHRRLVVHRDLKPSNILVTGAAEVKLLDFGIAKLLDPQAWEGAPTTRTAMRLLTPEYASPEQILGETVTTSSDVYQLGLLLYELLTGRRARGKAGQSLEEIERSLFARVPARPSVAVLRAEPGAGPSPEALAAARGTTPDRLRRELAGDLDAIVAKALAREPEGRYGSADQFADDLERWLDQKPVHARGASVADRARKFVRRHRVGAAFAAAAAAFILIYAGTVTAYAHRVASERDRARAEARKADEVRRFLLSLFDGARPAESKGRDVTASELLARGRSRLAELEGEPELRVELLGVLGQIYRELGHYGEAEALLEEGLRRIKARGGGPQLAATLDRLGDLRRQQGRLAEAESLLRQALELNLARHGPVHEDVALTLGNIGLTLNDRGLYAEAESVLRRALALEERVHGTDHLHVAAGFNDLAFTVERRGDVRAAEALYRRALDAKSRLVGEDHPSFALTLHNLARALSSRGALEEAEPVCRRALAIRRKALGAKHSEIGLTLAILARIRHGRGDAAEAEALFREAVGIQRESLKAHPQLAWTLTGLAKTLAPSRGREAEDLYREAVGILRPLGPPPHPSLSAALMPYGTFLCGRGRAGEALPLLEEARRIRVQAYGGADARSAESSAVLGSCLAGSGRTREGIALLEESVRVLKASSDHRLPATLAALAKARGQAATSNTAAR